jgi:hypothetical protein
MAELLAFFSPNADVRLDDSEEGSEEPKLLWKAVLRTGTWKLRPGPGGVKLKLPLKVFRDKAPKGHISLSALKKNFDAGAKENVTVPTVHADGTTSDSGFVRKLVIEDVKDVKGNVTESRLWAGMEITEPDIAGKIDRKSLVGVSGGILFDYERTEDAKKFDQILSHVMVTNSPWINGTGGFTNKLPDGVAASEVMAAALGEADFETIELDTDPAPGQADPPGVDPGKKDQPAEGTVVWKPNDGFGYIKSRLQRALENQRRALMARIGSDEFYKLDYPYYRVDDVQGNGESGKALICSGYGSENEVWVAGYKMEDDPDGGHDVAVIDAFQNWTPAKQEYVAASEEDPSKSGPREGKPHVRVALDETPLRRAQRERDDRIRNGGSSTPTNGGTMRLSDLAALGVELSEEQKAAIEASDEEQVRKDQQLENLLKDQRKSKATALLAQVKDTPLDTPGVKKYIESIVTSDDGGTALEFSEETDSGQRTQPVAKTATEIVEGFLAVLPRDKDGKLTLAQQARELPDDPKPPKETEEGEKDDRSTSEKADALLADLTAGGHDLGVPVAQNGGGA